MSWNLTCRKIRHSLALLSGNDLENGLEGASGANLRRHLAICPQCREQWQRLQGSQQALDRWRAYPKPLHASVWPSVERQLLAGDLQPVVAGDWRGWLPTGAVATACLTLLLLALPAFAPQSSFDEGSSAGSPIIFSQTVGAPVDQLEVPSHDERSPSRRSALPLPEVLRVRILLDGTDVREL